MGSSGRPSWQRYAQIESRQRTPKWLGEYQPAINAAREEAPPDSRPVEIYSKKIGRRLQVMSEVEMYLIPFALYHPDLVDIHEQKILSTIPTEHPLQSHPDAVGLMFPSMRGTVSIADSLGVLQHHPTVSVPDPDNPKIKIPYPWTGDLLLYLRKGDFLYCVNWTIKATADQFEDPRAMGRHVRNFKLEAEKLRARHAIEAIYYSDGSIPTHRITEKDCNRQVFENLRHIYGLHARTTPFDSVQSETILDYFKAGALERCTPIAVIRSLVMQFRFRVEDLRVAFYQAVWNRKLRIDLHDSIEIDRPMGPEKSDVLSDYAHWFSEA
jgi:hypothetical protein